MKRPDLLRVFLGAGLISLLVLYGILGADTLYSSEKRTGSDFIAFYAAGRILEKQGAQHVYDLEHQRAAEIEVLGGSIAPADVNPFVHPPFILPLLRLVIDETYVASFMRWSLLMLLLTAAAAAVLAHWSLDEAPTRSAALAGIGAVSFFPAFISFVNGQDTALLLLACALWAYGLSRNKDWFAGLGLGLAAIRPHVALVLAAPFLFNHRNVWWGFCASATALAILSALILGPQGVVNFIEILSVSAAGQGYHINETAMISLVGLMNRNAAWMPHEWIRMAAWIVYGAGIAGLCVLWARSAHIEEKHLGLAVLIGIFSAPHLHYHDAALLLIPIFALVRLLAAHADSSARHVILIPLIASFVLLFSYNELFKFAGLYVVMFGLGLSLWYPESVKATINRARAITRRSNNLAAQ